MEVDIKSPEWSDFYTGFPFKTTLALHLNPIDLDQSRVEVLLRMTLSSEDDPVIEDIPGT